MKHLVDFVNEQNNMPNYQNVTILGDGEYSGVMSGWVFDYKDNKYQCPFGIRGTGKMTIKIENGKVIH